MNEDYRRWLAELEYRPGWQMRIEPLPGLGPEAMGFCALTVTAIVDDARNPGHSAPITFTMTVPPDLERHGFHQMLIMHLVAMETHEAHEWLRHRDSHRPLFDPHDQGRRPR